MICWYDWVVGREREREECFRAFWPQQLERCLIAKHMLQKVNITVIQRTWSLSWAISVRKGVEKKIVFELHLFLDVCGTCTSS